jgi:DNA invertase Pin-like site-specific DNA recombinase
MFGKMPTKERGHNMFTYHGVTIRADEILVYLRKSRTDDPLMTVEEVLEKHATILNDWCMRVLGELVPEENVFKEIVSGETIAARPDFQKVLRLIEQPKYKAALVVDCSRLGRPDLEDIGRITKLFRYTNTFIITPDMAFDMADEFDRERLKMELERSNWYLEAYKKLNMRGRTESVRAGWYIGSVAPYGYDKIKVHDGRKQRPTLAIKEREAEVVRLIFDLYVNEDMGATVISHRLNELGYRTRKGATWTLNTIKDILHNEHYIGKVKWNWRKGVNVVADGEITKTRPKSTDYYVFDGKHPAIISEELFEAARAKWGKTARVSSKKQLRNPLAGLVYCQCGKAMSLRTYKTPDGGERSAPRMLCDQQAYCHTQSVTYDDLLAKVVDALKSCIADFEIQLKADGKNTVDRHAAQIKRLETRLEELNQKEVTQWEKYAEEGMPKAVFDKLNEKVLAEKETVVQAIETAKQNAPTVELYQERIARFSEALDALQNPNASVKDKNRLLKACIKRIDYSREKGTRWQQTEYILDITLND